MSARYLICGCNSPMAELHNIFCTFIIHILCICITDILYNIATWMTCISIYNNVYSNYVINTYTLGNLNPYIGKKKLCWSCSIYQLWCIISSKPNMLALDYLWCYQSMHSEMSHQHSKIKPQTWHGVSISGTISILWNIIPKNPDYQ